VRFFGDFLGLIDIFNSIFSSIISLANDTYIVAWKRSDDGRYQTGTSGR
jgi:hypothetical protein